MVNVSSVCWTFFMKTGIVLYSSKEQANNLKIRADGNLDSPPPPPGTVHVDRVIEHPW